MNARRGGRRQGAVVGDWNRTLMTLMLPSRAAGEYFATAAEKF